MSKLLNQARHTTKVVVHIPNKKDETAANAVFLLRPAFIIVAMTPPARPVILIMRNPTRRGF